MLPKLIKLLNPLPLLNNGKVKHPSRFCVAQQSSAVNCNSHVPKVDRQALLSDYDSRCKSAFAFSEAELRPFVPTELFDKARLVLDSVARILSCTDEKQKPTLSRYLVFHL